MIIVRTAARLHFGLLSASVDRFGRSFGGAGLMIDLPIELSARSLDGRDLPEGVNDQATDLTARDFEFKILSAASRCRKNSGRESDLPRSFELTKSVPSHVGLGSGTQVALATAACCDPPNGADEIVKKVSRWADFTGRGQRSGVGVHGFALGGFIVDAGREKPSPESVDCSGRSTPPLITRLEFPDYWPVVLLQPDRWVGVHGDQEVGLFRESGPAAADVTESMSALLLRGIIPAVAEKNHRRFAESMFEFNRRAGRHFADRQRGDYSDESIAELVERLRRSGLVCVGQSSWGPTVFAVLSSAAELSDRRRTIEEAAGTWNVVVTKARNTGASIETRV